MTPTCETHKRVLAVFAKASDSQSHQINGNEHNGYAPKDSPVSRGDYIEFEVCLDCGRVIGDFPWPEMELEKQKTDEEV